MRDTRRLRTSTLKPAIPILALFGSILVACASSSTKPQFYYGLSDPELDLLGRRLGYRVEALGMGDYAFIRGRHTFHVNAHYHESVTRRDRSASPVGLRYEPSSHRTPIESEIAVGVGISLEAAEDHFRRFLQKCHLPATPQVIAGAPAEGRGGCSRR
jgi:hypothetical protein